MSLPILAVYNRSQLLPAIIQEHLRVPIQGLLPLIVISGRVTPMTILRVTINSGLLPGKPIMFKELKGHHQPIKVQLTGVRQRHLQHIPVRVVLLQILPVHTDQPLLTIEAAVPEHQMEAASVL